MIRDEVLLEVRGVGLSLERSIRVGELGHRPGGGRRPALLVAAHESEQVADLALQDGHVVHGEGQRVVDLVRPCRPPGFRARPASRSGRAGLGLLELLVDLPELLVGRGELLGPPAQLLLGLDPLGDVLEVAADVIEAAVGVVARLGVDPHVVPLARGVAEPEHEVVPLAHLGRLAELVLGQGPVVRVEGVEEARAFDDVAQEFIGRRRDLEPFQRFSARGGRSRCPERALEPLECSTG